MREERIGTIIHVWPRAGAAQIELAEGHPVHVGDKVRIVGHGHEFTQTIESLEIDHRSRQEGWPGEHVAFAFVEPVQTDDEVFLLRER
jgi:hypothetical protein